MEPNLRKNKCFFSQAVLKMCSSALRCTFLAIALTICINWGHTKLFLQPRDDIQTCVATWMSHICSVHPLRSLRPSLCICLGTTERTTAAGIQTSEPLDKMNGSCYDLDEFILSILKDSQDELRTAYSMFLVGWTLDEWSAMVPDWLKKSINFLWLMHHGNGPPPALLLQEALPEKKGYLLGNLGLGPLWTELAPKCWLRQSYPLIRRRCQAVICDPVNPVCRFNFSTFLILRELIIHCGWRSKIANDSGSVAPCR